MASPDSGARRGIANTQAGRPTGPLRGRSHGSQEEDDEDEGHPVTQDEGDSDQGARQEEVVFFSGREYFQAGWRSPMDVPAGLLFSGVAGPH